MRLISLSTLFAAGPDQLQEQQEAAGAGEGVRPPLQHGPRGRQGDVDGAPQDRKG